MIQQQIETQTYRFHPYDLHPLLPQETQLILDRETDVLVALSGGVIIELQHFSACEITVAEVFLTSYPDYCPHEEVLAATIGKSVERCRAMILASIEDTGTLDPVMRPVRNLLGRTRLKFRPFGIEVKALPQMGYMLLPLKRQWRGKGE